MDKTSVEGFLSREFVEIESRILRPKNKSKPSLSDWASLGPAISSCTQCKLAKTRTNTVPGEGNENAKLVIVGEAPGEQEDLTGKPFVGRAGQLLTKMLEAIGLSRSDVFICNIVKCRPPENRNPEPDEIQKCRPFLEAQLGFLKPKLILALGKFSSQTLLKTEVPISQLRGKIQDLGEWKILPTFHPAYLLRNPSAKKEAWEDLKLAAAELGLSIPVRKENRI